MSRKIVIPSPTTTAFVQVNWVCAASRFIMRGVVLWSVTRRIIAEVPRRSTGRGGLRPALPEGCGEGSPRALPRLLGGGGLGRLKALQLALDGLLAAPEEHEVTGDTRPD